MWVCEEEINFRPPAPPSSGASGNETFSSLSTLRTEKRGQRYGSGVAREISENKHSGREDSLFYQAFPFPRLGCIMRCRVVGGKLFTRAKNISVTVGIFPFFAYLDLHNRS